MIADVNRRSRVAALCVAGVGPAACLGDTELVTPPPLPAVTITLEFRADTADLPTAGALGWADGIPDVVVTVVHEDSASGTAQTLHGSEAGTLTVEQLPAGRYRLDAVRWLTAEERARLPTGDDAVGFLARATLSTAAASAQMAVPLVASRRRGLIISEFKGDPIEARGTTEAYFFSGYIRLYNNADTVIYLDGLIVGSGLATQFDYPNFPCSLYLVYAMDPLGVWANYFHQLPGKGTDYPLRPGETAVLATDAIDHRPLYPIGLDLRAADFEFYAGASDVDNPEVPNALDVGMRPAFLGHGLYWSSLGTVVWLARSFELATMDTQVIPGTAGAWARIPANALLDVMAIKTSWQGSGYRECTRLVHPSFDRKEVQLLGVPFRDDTLAYRRLQLPFTITGIPVLQHTRTSALDFTTAARNPFAKP
jgi:hypothetical protein